MEQGAVGLVAQVGFAGRAEGGEGVVPGGALVGSVGGGFGADRVGGVVVAVQFAVGADRAGFGLPFEAVERVLGDRAECAGGPGECVVGGVLADSAGAGVHGGGDLGDVLLSGGVREVGDLLGPGAGRERD